jgi:hypothetical protein
VYGKATLRPANYGNGHIKLKAFIVVAGILLALLGWGVGGQHFQANQHGHSADCGTARNPQWSNSSQQDSLNELVGNRTDLESVCQGKAETRMWISWGLIIVGALAFVGGIVYAAARRDT